MTWEYSNQVKFKMESSNQTQQQTIATDRNFIELSQNKVNQKELPQLKRYFSSFTLIETKV